MLSPLLYIAHSYNLFKAYICHQREQAEEEDLDDVPPPQDLPKYTENVPKPNMSAPSTSQRINKQFRQSYGPGPNTGQTIPKGLKIKIRIEKGKRRALVSYSSYVTINTMGSESFQGKVNEIKKLRHLSNLQTRQNRNTSPEIPTK